MNEIIAIVTIIATILAICVIIENFNIRKMHKAHPNHKPMQVMKKELNKIKSEILK